MFKEVKEYIFSFRLLEGLDADLIEYNLRELSHSETPAEILISFEHSNSLDIFNSKFNLIGYNFNYSLIKGNILHFIVSENGFLIYHALIKDILSKFKSHIFIDDSNYGGAIYSSIMKYYCGKKKIPLFTGGQTICLRILPLSFLSSIRNNKCEGNSDFVIRDVLDKEIFIDDRYFYFCLDGELNRIEKDKVCLI